jgi:hypothetical protein
LVVYRISLAHPQCLQLLARTLNKIASADAVSTATATALRITRHGGTEGAAKTALWNGWLGEIPHCLWTNHHFLLVKSQN